MTNLVISCSQDRNKQEPTIPDWIFVQETIWFQIGTKWSLHEWHWTHAALQFSNVIDRFTQISMAVCKCTVWPVLGASSPWVRLVDTWTRLVVANVISTFGVASSPMQQRATETCKTVRSVRKHGGLMVNLDVHFASTT